ncbi:hypothetical protein [Streptomyces sp. 11-1-2]|uniref:hypothetical protein n=1 Tax=unclassified Streptomyces TaxID=2593676 RepID=UPI001F094AA5|nr:hypothetical protein [Streptomyces sp. 11-1-2]
MTTTHSEAAETGRLRSAWRAAHAPVQGVPRWARLVAYAVPLTVLPSSVWRIATVVFQVGGDAARHGTGDLPSWLPGQVYVICLSILSELLAFTAVGLIAGWGEVFPRWIPGLGGRRVPLPAAMVPAALGAAILTAMWTTAGITVAAGLTIQGNPLPSDFPTLTLHGWHLAFFTASYAPLLLWGPFLALLAIAYWQRRRRTPALAPLHDHDASRSTDNSTERAHAA